MTRKLLKFAGLFGLILAAVVTVTVVTSDKAQGEVPEYLGSQACLGCHTEKYVAWEESTHGQALTQLKGPADYPADPKTAPAELQAELAKADYIWHGYRFLAQDPVSGELVYLKVSFNTETKQYQPYTPRSATPWSQNCGGCHSGAVNSGIYTTAVEPAIGCESCHGPSRDHVLGKGAPDKIVSSTLADETCAQCHSGYNTAPNSTRWAKGYRPGMKLEDYTYFQFAQYDPAQAPRHMEEDNHLEEYPQWKASGHANATNLLINRGLTYLNRTECIYCHSAAAGNLIPKLTAKGEKWDAATMLVNDGVTCVSCHDPHGSPNKANLKQEPQALCISCHSIGRGKPGDIKIGTVRAPHSPQGDMFQGTGALDVKNTPSAHQGVTCVECHMTEGNHMMKVIKPSDAMATEGRVDSCTKCHTNSTSESRDVFLNLMQESVSARLEKIAADVKLIDAAIAANKEVLSADLNQLYLNARANFWYVQKDGSEGAHNFDYAIKVLNKSQTDMNTIKAALPK